MSVHSDSSDDGYEVAPANADRIQGISIRHHVPVILDMDEGNFGQWLLFFDSTLCKFGLQSHVRYITADEDRTGEWRMVNACVVNWILATVSKGVFDIVNRSRHDVFTLWETVVGVFQDNELQRAVYLEAELRTLQQGDMTINAYFTKLKQLADQLRDIGHPVSEPSQVLNLLRGLNPKSRYVKPVIISKSPPHTFMSARSFLILEELGADHDATAEAGQALTVSHGDRSGGSSNTNANANASNDGSSSSPASRTTTRSTNNNRNNRSDRRRGRGSGAGDGGGSSRQGNSSGPNGPWASGYNPWQGMVQA